MEIDSSAKQKIQLVLIAAIAIAAVRTGYLLSQRYSGGGKEAQTQSAPPLNPDYYVTPKKLYPYDLKSARELTLSESAILAANYIAQRVKDAYPLPYGPKEGQPMASNPCAQHTTAKWLIHGHKPGGLRRAPLRHAGRTGLRP